MNLADILLALFGAASVAIAWLVWTKKWNFPLLSDAGLSLIALGMLALGVSLHDNYLNKNAVTLIGIGIGFMVLSNLIQAKKRRKAQRHGEPRVIDGRHLHHPSGGRK